MIVSLADDVQLTRMIDAQARQRAEAAALTDQLRGQLELPLASTPLEPARRGQRAA